MNPYIACLVFGILCSIVGMNPSYARYKVEYDKLPQEVREWYQTRTLTPKAEERLHIHGCCDNADVVDTEFKSEKDPNGWHDIWYYKGPNGDFIKVPEDIIHWDEHAPGGKPVLFMYHGQESCFFPPSGAV